MANYEAQNYIVTNGLVLNLDAGDPDSYTRSQPPYVEVLVVAGGGGGGSHVGGGGGAGGLIYNSAYQLTSAAAVTVTVGGGGSGGSSDARGSNGSNSVFGSLTAIGGGGGGSWGGAGNPDGQNGGSGGGGAGTQGVQYGIGGTATFGQGFNGGTVGPRSGYNASGCGGGGASIEAVNRADASDSTKLNGAAGLPFSILGTTYYFAGGGGPGTFDSVAGGDGGAGGGAGGASSSSTGGTGNNQSINSATNGGSGYASTGGTGATNSGGGGGGGAGGSAGVGGAGGSGIVIVRYPGLPAATGGTITYVNGYTIHRFTSSGTFTPYLINDVTGNGFNGTLENNVGFSSYQNGGSLIFDGTDDQIPVISSNNFSNYSWSSGITVMVAYYIENILDFNNQFRALMGVTGGNRSFNYYLFGPNANSGLLRYHFSSIYGSGFSGDVSISNNTWYIGAFTSNGSTGTYYHNNTAIATQGMSTQSYTTAGGLQYFGRADNLWKGRIGYWLIYNRALSTAELTQNFNATRARFGI